MTYDELTSSRMTEGRYNEVLRERDEARAIARRLRGLCQDRQYWASGQRVIDDFDTLPWAKDTSS